MRQDVGLTEDPLDHGHGPDDGSVSVSARVEDGHVDHNLNNDKIYLDQPLDHVFTHCHCYGLKKHPTFNDW